MNAALSRRQEARTPTSSSGPRLFVVDDDDSVRESIAELAGTARLKTEVFASAHEFLRRPRTHEPSCLVLDVSLPDLNGLEVQEHLAERPEMPIIFITGNGDVPTSVRAMKAGALDFLTKPFDGAVLLRAVEVAVQRSSAALAAMAEQRGLQERYTLLSPREQQVMKLIVKGLLNKQVAGEMGIGEVTVKAHRGQVMRKMGVSSFAELVNLAAKLDL